MSNEQAASVMDAAGPPSSGASPPRAAAGSTTTTRHQTSPRPPPQQARRAAAERDQALDEARATFDLQTPRISRKRAAHQLRELGCTLDQIGAVFHVSKERIRQDLLWDPAARKPRRKPKPRTRLSPGKRNSSWVCQHRPSPRSPACSARPGAATEPGRTTLRPAVAVGAPGPERRNNLAAARQQP